jgi:hypothetical protein
LVVCGNTRTDLKRTKIPKNIKEITLEVNPDKGLVIKYIQEKPIKIFSKPVSVSESYLIVKGLTSAKLNDLKNQYSTFKSQGKNNADALKLAEAIAIP